MEKLVPPNLKILCCVGVAREIAQSQSFTSANMKDHMKPEIQPVDVPNSFLSENSNTHSDIPPGSIKPSTSFGRGFLFKNIREHSLLGHLVEIFGSHSADCNNSSVKTQFAIGSFESVLSGGSHPLARRFGHLYAKSS